MFDAVFTFAAAYFSSTMQGVLPDTPAVKPEVALRTADKTADKVWEVWTDQTGEFEG